MAEITKIIIEAIILVLAVGLISWQIQRLSLKVEDIFREHHQCRESLPKEYAAKDSVDKLWDRTDKIEADLHYFKGRMNGVKG
ncbi:MAG: hypothetical protein ACE14T_11220 [Syntrophales bacterium]